MANVPGLQGQRVAPGGPDAPSIRVGAQPQAFGLGIAQAGERLAGALNEREDVLNQHLVAMQQIQNSADADDSAVAFANQGNEILTNFTVNERGGRALPSLPDYETKLNEARDKGGENLNPVARKLYEANSRRLHSSMLGAMDRHAAEQNREYTVSAAQSAMDVARNLAVAHADDPSFLADALETIHDKGTFLSHYLGLGDEVGADKINEQTSKLFSEVIVQKANDNPLAAAKFFEDHKEEMKGEDISKIDSFLKQRTEPYIARQIVDDVVSGGSPEVGTVSVIKADPKGFFSRKLGEGITINSEVRPHSKQLELIQAWEAGGRKGVRPADNSYHEAANGYAVDIGTGSSGKSVHQLATELKAAGLHATEIVEEPLKHHVHIGWSNADLKAKATPGIDLERATTLTQLEGMRLAGHAAVLAQVEKVYGNDPRIKDMAETEFDSRYNRMHAALSAFTETAKNTVMSAAQGDGTDMPTSLEQIQRDPGVATSWQYLDAGQQRGVLKMLKQNANPPVSQLTAGQLEARDILDGESKANPAKFSARDPMSDPLYNQLPNSFRMAFMDRRNTIKAGQVVDSMTNRALNQVSPLLKDTEVQNTAENADNYNRFASKLSDEVKAFYDINKRAPSQVEARTMAQELLLDKATWGGKQHTLSAKAFETENFVPAWFQTQAAAEAKARGLTLSPEQVAALYQRRTARVR